jgi:xanthine permease XanP
MDSVENPDLKIDYKTDQTPPLVLSILSGLSHVFLYPVAFSLPVILLNSAGVSVDDTIRFSQVSLLAFGIANILMSLRQKGIGSGYLCPVTGCPSFYTASIIAAKAGGIALISGMLLLTGFFQSIISRILIRFRFLIAPEVMGVVVLVIGMDALTIAAPVFTGNINTEMRFNSGSFLVAVVTFLIMIVPEIRSSSIWKRYSVLIGVASGMAVSFIINLDNPLIDRPDKLSFFSVPPIGYFGLSFEWKLFPLFIIAGLASVIKSAACVVASRQVNGENTDDGKTEAIGGGMLSIGLSNILAGATGAMGISASAGNVGLSLANGVASRKVGFIIGAMLIGLSFSPAATGYLLDISFPVAGACLLYVTSFMLVLAFRLLTAQTFDVRKTFILGISISFGFCVNVIPELYGVTESSIMADRVNMATILAIILSIFFRIGLPNTNNTGEMKK